MLFTLIESIDHKKLNNIIAVDSKSLKTQEQLCIENNLLDDDGCDWNPEDMGYIHAETNHNKVYYLEEDEAHTLEDFANKLKRSDYE